MMLLVGQREGLTHLSPHFANPSCSLKQVLQKAVTGGDLGLHGDPSIHSAAHHKEGEGLRRFGWWGSGVREPGYPGNSLRS